MTPTVYRNVRPEQEGLIAALTERYATQKIRFDTGFAGSIPVQACGRIGRPYFYFRFRGDFASLTRLQLWHASSGTPGPHHVPGAGYRHLGGAAGRFDNRLNGMGIFTIADLKAADPVAMRKKFSVLMQRTIMELNGIRASRSRPRSRPSSS